MALPSSGQISVSDILTELGVDSQQPDANFRGLHSGDFGEINTNNPSADRPDGATPHAMSEFYSYDHNYYVNSRFYQNDGTSDYIDCTAGTAPFNINSTQDLSFSLWVRHTGSKQNQMIFNFGNTNANGNNRLFFSYSANLNRFILRVRTSSSNFDRQFALHDNSSVSGISSSSSGWSSTSRGNVNSDNFCMLTITYDASQTNAGSAWKGYWNDAVFTSQASSSSGTRGNMAATKGRIGENLHATNSAGNTTLDYDEIKIYNKVLSASEVTTLYNSGVIADSSQTVSSGLITEWTFDNNNANDSNSKYTNSIVGGNISTY